jgi:hypothetical protein
MNILYRYPGVKPFEAEDAKLFFGRERDCSDLYDIMCREKLVVLFAKSGYGKSSLIKAGLMPRLIANPNFELDANTGNENVIPNVPIYIRFNLYNQTNKLESPCDKIITRLKEELRDVMEDTSVINFFQGKKIKESLWTRFKAHQTQAPKKIYLIFDQFEEFFSYPVEEQAKFQMELSELLYTQIPQSVRDVMTDADRALKNKLHQKLQVNALFSLRSDRIHLLNNMRESLPAILNIRYELNALSVEQARSAIVEPARLGLPSFLLKQPFEYEPEALSKILSELSKSAKEEITAFEPLGQVEAFQLQIVCQTIEQNLISHMKSFGGKQKTVIILDDLPEFEKIYEQYYSSKLDDLTLAGEKQKAHLLLEEELVIGEDLSEVRRISMDRALLLETMQANHQLEVTDKLLDYLENKFLLRRENISGHAHYELSHDLLLAPVVKARDEARKKIAEQEAKAAELEAKNKSNEQQLAAEQREKEARLEAAKERELRIKENRSRIRYRNAAFIALFACFAALFSLAWAVKKSTELKDKNKEIEKQNKDIIAQKGKTDAALRKIISARKDELIELIKLDEKAEFTQSAGKNVKLLEDVKNYEKADSTLDVIIKKLEQKLEQ